MDRHRHYLLQLLFFHSADQFKLLFLLKLLAPFSTSLQWWTVRVDQTDLSVLLMIDLGTGVSWSWGEIKASIQLEFGEPGLHQTYLHRLMMSDVAILVEQHETSFVRNKNLAQVVLAC